MGNTINKPKFLKEFTRQFVNIKEMAPGSELRTLAGQVNDDPDSTLRSEEEFADLFDRLDQQVDTDGVPGQLTVETPDGALTPVGQMVEQLEKLARDANAVFDFPMETVHIVGWPQSHMTPQSLAEPVSFPSASLALYPSNPASQLHCPPVEANGVLLALSGDEFTVRISGNFTAGTPKSSIKINVKDKEDRLGGLDRLNLKSMWNDVSQMREALAWHLFAQAGVAAPDHTYAKLIINDKYFGLYSLIEQVDKTFLKDHFGKNDEGNLYKAYWDDIGPASLGHRVDLETGDDSGAQYHVSSDMDARTYRLKSNEDDPEANTYDDLAELVRVINGLGLPGGDERFNTDAYKERVEEILNAKAFLRWAAVNVLLGAWDNYWATPGNYYLYNSGKKGGKDEFMEQPYFTWIPWDYDNSFGIDFFGTQWQYTDIVDWASGTKKYYKGKKTADIPLITNLLKNEDFLRYYLDFVEHMLDTDFNEEAIAAMIGVEGGDGLWEQVRHAAYLESDSPQGPPHTGRQFTNDEVYRHGYQQHERTAWGSKIEGIIHYVRMRHDSARAQLEKWRETYPQGSSGAVFDGKMEPLPKAS